MHFCRLLKVHLLLNGTQIPVVEQAKFLGLIFDRKLTFLPHLRYLRQKCMKALNVLQVLAHAKWGSDEATLLHLYRSLIRSKLEYGLWLSEKVIFSYAASDPEPGSPPLHGRFSQIASQKPVMDK